ncbi:uncharacterized protein LOC136026852 [Artemia franciscana]|uniref:uncharacterized protein LOC136026852 n=1 Tax=Artemia franciscana TaxID=6661 RepID=UPI0032DB4D93
MKTICFTILVLVAVASAAPRKVVVRRQAETATSQDAALKPETDKKPEGTEEVDERFRQSGFRRPIQSVTNLASSSVQQGGFGRPLGSGLGGTQSGFGQTGFGQTGFGRPGLGQTGLGQTGFGQTGFGQTGLGQTGLGQTGFGQTGFGQNSFGQTGFGQSGLGQSSIGRPVGSGLIGK